MRRANHVARQLLESVWQPPGDPVSDSNLVHSGDDCGIHFGTAVDAAGNNVALGVVPFAGCPESVSTFPLRPSSH